MIDDFVKEHGPLVIAGKDGCPVLNAAHAFHFYTNFGIPVEVFEDWANELIASKEFNHRV